MKVGVPKEIKAQEHRVALTPASVQQLVQRGHEVFVETQAGASIGYDDNQYKECGAIIVDTHEKVFEEGELIVKVKEPLPAEYDLFRSEHILFTYLHYAADKTLTEAMMKTGATTIAYETVEVHRKLPLLEPMSEIAGRMATIAGANHLAKHHGGRGLLLGGVPGVLPANVVVIGGGCVGVNAARMAMGLGAQVYLLDIDLERLRFLDQTMPGLRTVYSNEANLTALLKKAHLVIGAVLLPGAKAPKLIKRSHLREMEPGSVIVDIAIDQGGCTETSRPTTHEEPTYVEEGVVHYCVANMPGAYARTATQALNNVTVGFAKLLADCGVKEACQLEPALKLGVNTYEGALTNKAVAEAHDLPYAHIDDLLYQHPETDPTTHRLLHDN